MSHDYAVEATRAVEAGHTTVKAIARTHGWHIATIGRIQAINTGRIHYVGDGYLATVEP